MKILEIAGNGSCLFSSLRLGLELATVCQKLHETGIPDARFAQVFYGRGPLIDREAEALRLLICKWYNPIYYDKEIPFAEGPTTRRKILELELCSEDNTILEQYVQRMKQVTQWGSVPEIIAFAMMTGADVTVYQPTKIMEDPKDDDISNLLTGISSRIHVQVMQQVKHPNSTFQVHLLYTGKNHYDLLIEDTMYAFLESAYAFLKNRVSPIEVQK